jgi:uncharacterized protein (UPF0332 family)
MTEKQTLFKYRLKQADETLSDVEKMLQENLSPRSIINRSYYSMFYAILALFLKTDINLKTSKHSGVISIFDKEFVELSAKDAAEAAKLARKFIAGIKEIIHI